MVAVFRWLAHSLGFGDPFADARLRARLTEEEALAIAQKAAVGLPHDLSIRLAAITEEAGERLWVFSTNTRGLTWQVKIRDRDGHVVGSGRVGIR